MRDARQRLVIDPFALQHRGDLVASWHVHQRTAAQIRHAVDVRPARNQNDGRGALEDSRQHDQPAAHRPFAQNADAADAEIRLAAGNRFSDVDTGTAFADGNVEARVAVETLLKRRVVASELKLVLPFELQGYLIQRSYWMRSQQDQASRHDQPS